jgi:predicted nucleotidyltransferase
MSEECAIQAMPRLGDLARRFSIRMILQFGSTVTGTTHARSDLDLAVQLDSPNMSFQTVLEIQEALQAQFPGREVDLAILNLADPLFMKKSLSPAVCSSAHSRLLPAFASMRSKRTKTFGLTWNWNYNLSFDAWQPWRRSLHAHD